MTTKYHLAFSPTTPERTKDILRGLSYSSSIYRIEGRTFFHYFDDNAEEEMPIATTEGLSDGIYFCDHGKGEMVLSELLDVLHSMYDNVVRKTIKNPPAP